MSKVLSQADVIVKLAALDAEYVQLKKDIDDYFRNASHDPYVLRRMECKLKRIGKTMQKIKQPSLL